MKPALTAEEWAGVIPSDKEGIIHGYLRLEDKHGMAAQCLHDQPFGFTREDVELLMDEVAQLKGEFPASDWMRFWKLADRIEALLPPEEEG